MYRLLKQKTQNGSKVLLWKDIKNGASFTRFLMNLPIVPPTPPRPYYCEVEYISFDGASYIDTGIYSSSELKVEIYFRGSRTNVNRAVFGGREATGTRSYVIWHNLTSSSYAYYMRFDYSSGQKQSTSTWQDDEWIKVVKDKEDNYMNDVAQPSNNTASFLSSTTTVVLGAVKTGTTSFSYNYFLGDVSHCKVWDNGTLVRDYIPVIDWNGIICWYDKVNDQFYYNEGTGDFTAGRQIHFVDYIETSGTQYINTGLSYIDNNYYDIETVLSFNTVTVRQEQGTYYGGYYGVSSTGYWQLSNVITDKAVYADTWYKTNVVGGQEDNKNRVLTVTNISTGISTEIGTVTGANNTDYIAYLMASNTSNTSDTAGSANLYIRGKFRYHKITDLRTNDIVQEFYPAVDENGVGFMFDKIQHRIYDNAGTGAFTYPDVELDYLTSDGNQYIDSGILPDNTTGVKLKIALPDVTTDIVRFGCRQANDNSRFIIGNRNGYVYFGFGSLTSNQNDTITENVPFVAKLNYYNDGYSQVDDNEKRAIGDLSGVTFTYTAILFGRNYYGTIAKSAQSFYECQMTRGNNLILDLIPVIHNGTACIYDKVNNSYLTNQGTGDFTYKIKEQR